VSIWRNHSLHHTWLLDGDCWAFLESVVGVLKILITKWLQDPLLNFREECYTSIEFWIIFGPDGGESIWRSWESHIVVNKVTPVEVRLRWETLFLWMTQIIHGHFGS
jgi:hypothetical protein